MQVYGLPLLAFFAFKMAQKITIAELETLYTANTKQLEAAATKAERRVKESADRMDSSLGKIGSGALSVLGGNLLTSAISRLGGAIGGFVKQGVEFDDLKERALIAFTTISGSADDAKKHLDNLIDFGTKTPYRADQLIDLSQRLQGVGFAAKDIIPILTDVGDAVAGLGNDPEKLESIIDALSKIKTEGRVSGRAIEQIAIAGIPAWKILAEAAGVSVHKMRKKAESGALDTDKAIQVIVAGAEKRFPGMMKKVEGTYSALLSNLEDTTQQRAGQIFQPLFEESKKAIAVGIDALNSPAFNSVANGAAGVQKVFFGGLNSALGALASGDFLGLAKSLGEALPEGLIKGIQDGTGAAIGAVKDFAGNAIEGAKDILGIQSPSRVFYELGEMCALGFELGFQDGSKKQGTKIKSREGDTLRKIAERMGIPIEQLTQRYPRLSPEQDLQEGQEIFVPNRIDPNRGGGLSKHRARGLAVISAEVDSLIVEFSNKYGVDPNLIRAMMMQESGGQNGRTSSAGAKGLMQLMPGTAKHYGVSNIFDPRQNVEGGVHYMADLLGVFGGNPSLALAGYNAGEGRVKQFGGVPPPSFAKGQTFNYVNSIMAMYAAMSNSPDPLGAGAGLFRQRQYQAGGVMLPSSGLVPPQMGGDLDGGAGLSRTVDANGLPFATQISTLPAIFDLEKFGAVDGSMLKILADFTQLNSEAPKLKGGFDDAGDSVSQFGQLALDAKGHVQGLMIQSEEAGQRLKVSWDDVASGFENVFVGAFDRIGQEDFPHFAGDLALDFGKMLLQLEAQALAANLSKALFGFTGDKGSAGSGFFGKLAGWIGSLLGGGLFSGSGAGKAAGGLTFGTLGGALAGIGGHASGGHAQGWSWVGEQGKELAYFGGNGAQIYSNSDSKKMMGGNHITNIINVPVSRSSGYTQRKSRRQLGDEIVRRLA